MERLLIYKLFKLLYLLSLQLILRELYFDIFLRNINIAIVLSDETDLINI